MAKKRLGKGIDALLQGRDLGELEKLSSVTLVPIEQLKPNPNQPRKTFSEEHLAELADSVRERGIIQPILAEETEGGNYLIIAGERRYRAAKMAGLDTVPVLTRDFSEEEKLEIALIENIQREDLNPIEEAVAFRSLMETAELTQEELADRLGKNRSTIANSLRLLRLPQDVQASIAEGAVSAGHARAILSVAETEGRTELLRLIRDEGISVREAERASAALNAGTYDPSATLEAVPVTVHPRSTDGHKARSTDGTTADTPEAGPAKSVELQNMEDQLLEALGTRVVIRGSDHRGRIQIEYFSMDDLERIYEIIRRGGLDR